MLKGSCQCQSVQYRLNGEPMMLYACHCTDCQKRTGSAFSMGIVALLGELDLEGPLSTWTRTSDDGNTNTRYSCAECGNIIYGVSSHSPELIKLQPGTLEQTKDLHIDAHIWTRSAQRWLTFNEGSLRYDTQPEELAQVYIDVLQQRELQ